MPDTTWTAAQIIARYNAAFAEGGARLTSADALMAELSGKNAA